MNSTSIKSIAEKPSIPPVFSYAQAAKGRPAVTAAFANQMNQPVVSNPIVCVRDVNSMTSTSSQGSLREDRSGSESLENQSKLESCVDVMNLDSKAVRYDPADSPPTTPGLGTTSVSSPVKENEKDDDFNFIGSTSCPMRDQDSAGKSGKGQKSNGNETDKDETKPEILVPAPLPAVNFWQQRKEKLAKSMSPQVIKNTKNVVDLSGSIDRLPNTSNKNMESKKRNKQVSTDNSERHLTSNQNGLPREAITSGRITKKGSNGPSKFKEEQTNKRNGTRGGRLTEKDDKSSSNQAPPPVEDAISWPTPETVFIEDKRKVQEKQERDEKEENTSNKPRQKEKWVPVPYIPTVTFNTPIPTRGGRARGGVRSGRGDHDARSNHGPNSTISAEKLSTLTQASPHSCSEADRRSIRDNSSTTSVAPARRQSGDITNNRKSSVAQFPEKTRSHQPKSENHYQNESYHVSSLVQSGQISEENPDLRAPSENQSFKNTQAQSSDVSGNSNTDRRAETNQRHSDHGHFGRENGHQPRERIEGRSDRGRGGFRSRGTHSNYANGQSHQNNFSNGTSSQHQNGYNIRQGPYSPPLAPPFSTHFVAPSRPGRVGPRSQSIPSNGTYGRFSQNGGGVSQQLTSLQTTTPMYDYSPIQPMSAPLYQPYNDQVSVFTMVTMQLEYYFSIDNLCKDVFLRKHMDSQGFVYLSFIAGFKRIVALTQDFELIRFACQESEVIELVRGEDGIDRLRRKEGWEKWVLTVEEREDSVKNSAPNFWHPAQFAPKLQHVGPLILTSPHPACIMPYSVSESGYPPYSKDGSIVPSLNRTDTYQPPTPLSAAVPDFAPSLPPIDTSNELLDAETNFHEDEVTNLTLVFASPEINNGEIQPRTKFYNQSTRTFSNGSIDRKSITEGLYDESNSNDNPLVNGLQKPEILPESRSRSKSPHSPSRSDLSNGPPVMWVKGQRQQVPISERNSQELYINFRARALRNREISIMTSAEIHPDMKLLYEFWSHFLCRNFNSQMYLEFRRFAIEDARTGSLNGMSNLISYYDEILNSKKKVIPEILARHYIELVNMETSDGRPAFEKLRAAWRNGALDLKSRKRIDNLMSPRLRQEIEQAPHQNIDSL